MLQQSQAEVVSKSRNKIHQTWEPPFSRALCSTHRLDVLLQAVDVLLEEVERARLAAVPREGRRARRVDRVHPVLKLNLARRLQE